MDQVFLNALCIKQGADPLSTLPGHQPGYRDLASQHLGGAGHIQPLATTIGHDVSRIADLAGHKPGN